MENFIFVTAATGNIGREIVKNLQNASANFAGGISPNENTDEQNFTAKVMDYGDPNSLKAAFEDAETLFLLLPFHPEMVNWAKNAVEAAKAAGVKHIVRSSGAGADSSASFMMPKVQGQIDDLVRNSGLNYTLVGPASFMQNFFNHHGQDVANGAIYMPVGNGKIGWVDTRDIAAVNAVVLQNPASYEGQTLTVTGGENLNYAECVATLSEVLGREISFTDVPDEAAEEALKGFGMPQFSVDMLMSLNQIIKAGYAEGVTDTVEKITGKKPITFRQFAEDYKSVWA